ncbi:unnamed protein product [Rhizophagus irregularis]|nr:unnamed protein product [Rhizophagus irregularis]
MKYVVIVVVNGVRNSTNAISLSFLGFLIVSWIILRDDSLITVYGFKIVSGCLLAVSEWFLWIKNTDFCTGSWTML